MNKIFYGSLIIGIILFTIVVSFSFAQVSSFSPFFITSTSTNSGISTTTAAQLRRQEWVIGLGTSTPIGKLTIHGTTDDLLPYHFFVASSTPTATSTHFVIRNNGNIGVATSVPQQLFSVHGTGLFNNLLVDSDIGESTNRVANGYFDNVDTTLITIGSFASGDLTVRRDLFVNGNDFNLGSGIATSTYSGTASSTMQAGFSFGGGGIASSKGLSLTGGLFRTDVNTLYSASSTSTIPNLTSAFTFATSTTNTPLLTLSTKSSRYGRVGIGTSTPSALFAINALNSSNQADNIFYIGSSTAANIFTVDNHGNVIMNGGNVGIGTLTPGALLSIKASASSAAGGVEFIRSGSTQIMAKLYETTGDANFELYSGATEKVHIDTVSDSYFNGGNVGIGTTGPEEKLSVAGNIAFSGSGTVYELRSNSADGSDNKYLAISSTGTAGAARGSYIELRGNEFANNVGMLHLGAGNVGSTGTEGFITFTTGADLTRMVIDRSGNVGIGTTSPGLLLGVAGDILLQMNQPETTNGVCHSGADIDAASSDGRALVVCSAAPGDIAEWYEAQSDVEEGDIVSLSQNLFSYTFSPSNPFTGVIDKATIITEEAPIIKKAEETNSLLLGVVSASPYQTFGNAIRDQGTHPKPVALIGRVQVKVSQENGPIAIGDRIAVSSEAGIGRKANPDEQTIGIALNPYEGEGIGMILVFINLGHTKLDPSISSGQVTTENSGMWWINQTTGELTSNGMPLNIQGATINNVNAIYSASGNWRIDGEGRLVVQSVKTQKLEVGSSGQPEGVTLYDKATGLPYCSSVINGVAQLESGSCGIGIATSTP